MLFIYDFLDSATVWCYNLISVHHDICYFIIIILSLVYWSLYKIIKDNSWNSFNKQEGLLRHLSYAYPFLLYIEIVSFWLWIRNAFLFIKIYHDLVIDFMDMYLDFFPNFHTNFFLNKFIITFLNSLGKVEEEDIEFPAFVVEWCDRLDLLNTYKERYTTYLLYDYPTNAFFFSDDNDDFLTVQRFRESTTLEFIFAIFPTVIIAMILLPSIYLLYSLDENLDPKFTIKVIGHQWFWSYEFDNFLKLKLKRGPIFWQTYNFDSILVQEEDLFLGTKRLLEVDNRLILPINVTLRFVITSADVLHSWALPELGIKVDAVPGRLNQFITLICKPGVYYGQCSELCGVSHGFMPIVIQAVPYDVFIKYLNLTLK